VGCNLGKIPPPKGCVPFGKICNGSTGCPKGPIAVLLENWFWRNATSPRAFQPGWLFQKFFGGLEAPGVWKSREIARRTFPKDVGDCPFYKRLKLSKISGRLGFGWVEM